MNAGDSEGKKRACLIQRLTRRDGRLTMAELPPKTGAEATSGTQRNRRRLLKGAAAIAPVIVTMRSSAAWASSTGGCGQVIQDIDPRSNIRRRLNITRTRHREAYDAYIANGRVALEQSQTNPDHYYISASCWSSFNS